MGTTERFEIDLAALSPSTGVKLEFRDLQRKIRPLLILTQREAESELERQIQDRNVSDDVITEDLVDQAKHLLLRLEARLPELTSSFKYKYAQIKEQLESLETDENAELGYSVASLEILDKLNDLSLALRGIVDQRNSFIQANVQEIREELKLLWKECMLKEREGDFPEFHSVEYTNPVLAEHKAQLVKWKTYYKKNQALFRQVEKREKLWQKMKELEAFNHDPNRFINRGGALLKTQKEMQQVSAALPKCEEKLKALAIDFERENGKKVYIQGKEIADLISSDWAAYKEGMKQGTSISRRTLRPQAMVSRHENDKTPASHECLKRPQKRTIYSSNPCLPTKKGKVNDNDTENS